MSYQVFARKWRPKNFSQVAGQQHVLQALSHALAKGQVHHAYLFTGTRGVGKTTLARIIAKCLNCETGLTHQPCGECTACCAIDNGNFIDLLEVDAASKTKVEDTRALLENIQFAPSIGRYKVYLIDEVHMLSGHSFNALLKTLEEPPEHVVFILATTEPDKLPITILSRCLKLHLKHLSETTIMQQLITILNSENIQYEEPALSIISRAAEGSMRDALSLLEQANMMGEGCIQVEHVSSMLGLVDRKLLSQLLHAIADSDINALQSVIQSISEFTDDYQMVLSQLTEQLTEMAYYQMTQSDNNKNLCEKMDSELASKLTPEQIQLFYQIALQGRKDLTIAPLPRVGFEMLMLRMMLFEPAKQATAVVQKKDNQPAGVLSQSTSLKREQAQLKSVQNKTQPIHSVDKLTTNPAKLVQSTDTIANDKEWTNIVAKLQLSGLAKVLVSHCALVSKDATQITLNLTEQYALMLTEQIQKQIEQALSDFLQTNIKLNMNTTSQKKTVHQPTPANIKTPQQVWADKAQGLVKKNKPLQKLINHFDGSITDLELKDKSIT